MKVTAYHGTSTGFEGYPSPQSDIYGFNGIFLTEDEGDAWDFAEGNTEGRDDQLTRVFSAKVDLANAVDLTELEGEGDEFIAFAIEAIDEADADVAMLPDLSGMQRREILVVNPTALEWTGVEWKDEGERTEREPYPEIVIWQDDVLEHRVNLRTGHHSVLMLDKVLHGMSPESTFRVLRYASEKSPARDIPIEGKIVRVSSKGVDYSPPAMRRALKERKALRER